MRHFIFKNRYSLRLLPRRLSHRRMSHRRLLVLHIKILMSVSFYNSRYSLWFCFTALQSRKKRVEKACVDVLAAGYLLWQ